MSPCKWFSPNTVTGIAQSQGDFVITLSIIHGPHLLCPGIMMSCSMMVQTTIVDFRWIGCIA